MGEEEASGGEEGAAKGMELGLVPIEDLLDEISKRSECYIAAYKLKIEGSKQETIYTHWQNNVWFKNLALCAALQKDLLDCCKERRDTE